jgi:hypothetical protein
VNLERVILGRQGAADVSSAELLTDCQLYDLANDISERTNVQAQHPEVVERLTKLLEEYVADGRSTPGPAQSNTSPVAIFRTQKLLNSTKAATP